MKRIIQAILLVAAVIAGVPSAAAQVNISRTEATKPTDEVFMDMAVTVAQTAVAQGHKPSGAVIALNGAWRASGMAVGGRTAEQDAIARSRRTSLPTAVVYTINQPTDEAVDAMAAAGIKTVYYVNPFEDVVAAGAGTSDSYAGASTPREDISIIRLDYQPAADLLKKSSK